eukprot:Opistho-2@35400
MTGFSLDCDRTPSTAASYQRTLTLSRQTCRRFFSTNDPMLLVTKVYGMPSLGNAHQATAADRRSKQAPLPTFPSILVLGDHIGDVVQPDSISPFPTMHWSNTVGCSNLDLHTDFELCAMESHATADTDVTDCNTAPDMLRQAANMC